MKLKHWVKYLVYIAAIYFALVLRTQLEALQKQYIWQNGSAQYSLCLLSIAVIGVLIGALLGLDHILVHRKRAGKWHVNWPKLIVLGVPSLLLSLYLFTFSAPFFLSFINALMPLYARLTYDGGFIVVFELILGYAVMTSFYKKEPV